MPEYEITNDSPDCQFGSLDETCQQERLVLEEAVPEPRVYTHLPITGYCKLTQAEVDLINRVKHAGIALEVLLSDINDHLNVKISETHGDTTEAKAKRVRIERASPMRWLAMARSDMQIALMKLSRAIAQPSTFA